MISGGRQFVAALVIQDVQVEGVAHPGRGAVQVGAVFPQPICKSHGLKFSDGGCCDSE